MRARLLAVYLFVNIALGSSIFLWALFNWHSDDRLRFASFLVAGVIASVLKIQLPGVTETASVSVLVITIAIALLTPCKVSTVEFSLGKCEVLFENFFTSSAVI